MSQRIFSEKRAAVWARNRAAIDPAFRENMRESSRKWKAAKRALNPPKPRVRLSDDERRSRRLASIRKYRAANNGNDQAYYLANAEKIKARVREQSKTEHGRKLTSERHAQRKERDENYRIMRKLRSSIGARIKRYTGSRKAAKCVELLGCSIEFFRGWIEAQFQTGMTWANHGLHTWHIDHRIPCAEFDLRDPEQQKKCFNYTNLQPLWALDNLHKAAKLIYK